MRSSRGAVAAIVGMFVVGSGCGASDPGPEAGAVGDGEVQGLTREQIEEHAEAMSPEVAESLGIIDTTIRIESPMPAESVRPPTLAPDTVPAQ